MAVKVVNARDIRNQVGMNGIPTDATGAGMLDFLNVRWIRLDLVNTGSTSNVLSGPLALKSAMANVFDPTIKYQVIVDGYYNNRSNFSWNTQQTYLKTALTITNTNGTKIIRAVEGPNEWGWGIPGDGAEQGGGSVFPNGTTDQDQGYYTAPNSVIFSGIQQWSQAIAQFRTDNSSLFTGVDLLTLTYLDYSGSFGDYPSNAKVSQYVDYGNMHQYTGLNGSQYGTWAGSPSAIGYQGAKMYHGMQGGFDGDNYTLPMVVSETGPYNAGNGGGWATDGATEAWTTAHTLFDIFAMGGRRVIFYTAWNHANFQFFSGAPSGPGNRGTPKPKAQILRNIMTLLSLGNNYKATANLSDTSSFSATYNASSLSISMPAGDNPGQGSSVVVPWPLVMPKSDGSTMIAVWREPKLDDASNASTSTPPAATSTTVSFGSSQNWKLWDPSGSGDGRGMSFADSPSQLSSGTGSSATFNLYGVPLLIELTATATTSAPPTPSGVSISNVTATRAKVSWTAGTTGQSNSPTGYDIQYQKGSTTGTWLTFASVDSSSTSYTIFGLDTSSQYYARVIATNSVGSSGASSSQSIATTSQLSTNVPQVVGTNYAIVREDNGSTDTGGGTGGGGTGTGKFVVQNGQIIDPNGIVFLGRGINITDDNKGNISPVT